jgi:hypothetical protein
MRLLEEERWFSLAVVPFEIWSRAVLVIDETLSNHLIFTLEECDPSILTFTAPTDQDLLDHFLLLLPAMFD